MQLLNKINSNKININTSINSNQKEIIKENINIKNIISQQR